MTELSKITSFKVVEEDGNIRVEMTGEGLFIPSNAEKIPNVRVWHALSSVIAEAANAPALIHRLTTAFNNKQASMRANTDANGLILAFEGGTIPDSIKQILVRLGEDEQATLSLINASVAEDERNIAEFRKRFPRGTGYRHDR